MYEVALVYGLRDPRDRRIYYVGCTSSPQSRLIGHLEDARATRGTERATPKDRWIAELLDAGLEPDMVPLDLGVGSGRSGVPEAYSARAREQIWIRRLSVRGEPLLNRPVGWPAGKRKRKRKAA